MTAGRGSADGGWFGVATRENGAFTRFYDATAAPAYGLGLRITGEAGAAEAACEAAYLDLWADQPLTAFEAPAPALTDRLMELVRARAVASGPAAAERPSPGGPAAYTLEATVRSAVAGLTPLARRALELAHYGGLSVAAIAELTGEPTLVIRSSLREALLTIAALTKEQENRP